MTRTLPGRFTIAAPPNLHAGIGNALRMAFRLPESMPAMFDRLLLRLSGR